MRLQPGGVDQLRRVSLCVALDLPCEVLVDRVSITLRIVENHLCVLPGFGNNRVAVSLRLFVQSPQDIFDCHGSSPSDTGRRVSDSRLIR